MAEAILKYNLSDEDDAMSHMRAVKSLDVCLALWQIMYNMRRSVESEVESKNLDGYDAVDLMYQKMWDELNSLNINLNELIT